jgi:hypothetical protein
MTQNERIDNNRERGRNDAEIRRKPNPDRETFNTCKQTIHNILVALFQDVDWVTFTSDASEIKAIDEDLRGAILQVNSLKVRPITRKYDWDFITERLVFALMELSRARQLAGNSNVQGYNAGGDMQGEDKYAKMANCGTALRQAEREMEKPMKNS